MSTLRDRWAEYARSTLTPSASEAQVTDAVIAFYAGALATIDALREAFGPGGGGEGAVAGVEREAREFRSRFLTGDLHRWR